MSRRSRDRANSRPWEQEPDDDQPEHDDTERCPNTGELFEEEQDAMQRHPGQAGA